MTTAPCRKISLFGLLSSALAASLCVFDSNASTIRDGYEVDYPAPKPGLTLPQVIGDSLPRGHLVLTYDDGLDEYSTELGRYLQSQNIRAIFFVNGCRFVGRGQGYPCSTLKQYPTDTMEQIVKYGHEIGNHTELHYSLKDDLPAVGAAKIKEGVLLTQTLIDPYQRNGYVYLRAPSNNWGQAPYDLLHGLPELGNLIGPVFYDFSIGDWACNDTRYFNPILTPEQCAQRYYQAVLSSPTRSGILQLHDRNPNAVGSDYTLRLTRALVDLLRADTSTRFVFTSLDAIPGMTGTGNFLTPSAYSSEFSDAGGTALFPGHYRSIRMGDVNGDGSPDICGKRVDGIYCIDGRSRAVSKWKDLPDDQGWRSPQYSATTALADLDKDGRADLCVRGAAGLYCFRSDGHAFASAVTWWSGGSFSDAEGWATDESMYASIQMGDIDGDGAADVCGRDASGIVCQRFTGAGFGPVERWISGKFDNVNHWNNVQYAATLRLGDINGDGRADLCGRASYGMACSLSRGTGFDAPTWWSASFSDREGWAGASSDGAERAYFRTLVLADLNGDGKADLCGQYETGVVCADSVGDRFGAYRHIDNRRLTGSAGYGAPAYALTLMIGDVEAGAGKEVCTRGPTGIVCLQR